MFENRGLTVIIVNILNLAKQKIFCYKNTGNSKIYANDSTGLRGYVELEDGWISPFNGYQYKVNDTRQSWNESRIACQSWGGDLIVHGFRDHTARQYV